MSTGHICNQDGRISRIESELEHQSERDTGIEAGLKNLMEAVQRNHDQEQKNQIGIASNFGKLEAILVEQGKRIDESKTIQTEIKDGLGKLSNRVTAIELKVEQNVEDIKDVRSTSAAQDERLKKIEKWIIYIIAAFTVISGIFQFISSFDSIKYKLFPELNNINVEQVKVVNK